MAFKEIAITRLVEAGGRLRVRSALNPILWLTSIITPACLIAYSWMTNPAGWLLVLAFIPVIACIVAYFILLIVDRDKLQSEEFQIRKRELEIIQEKGSPPILSESVITITDPDTKLIQQ